MLTDITRRLGTIRTSSRDRSGLMRAAFYGIAKVRDAGRDRSGDFGQRFGFEKPLDQQHAEGTSSTSAVIAAI